MKALTTSFYAAYTVLYGGFYFHRSAAPDIGPYSLPYIAFLAGLASAYALPAVLSRLARRFGRRRVAFSFIPAGFLVVIGYVVGAQVYYHSQGSLFDPFLQKPSDSPPIADDERPRNSLKVLALGGSTTFNGRLPEEDRYPAQLQRLLADSLPGTDVEVLNGGMDWYTSRHSLINYTTRMQHWKPDVVIVMHAINDIVRSFEDVRYSAGEYKDDYSHYYGCAIRAARPRSFEGFLWERMPMQSRWFSTLRDRKETDHPIEKYKSLTPFKRHLHNLIRYCAHDNVDVFIMTQPYLLKESMTKAERSKLVFASGLCRESSGFSTIQPSTASLRNSLEAFNHAARSIAAAEGVDVIDAEKSVPKDIEHFVDDVHYTERGATIVAQTAARVLLQRYQPEDGG